MFGISAVVAVLLISLSVQSASLRQKNEDYAVMEANLKKQIEQEKKRTDEIQAMEEYMQSDEYIEEVARDKLGLVYEDETIFKPEQ